VRFEIECEKGGIVMSYLARRGNCEKSDAISVCSRLVCRGGDVAVINGRCPAMQPRMLELGDLRWPNSNDHHKEAANHA
jgi:hypothetical protein